MKEKVDRFFRITESGSTFSIELFAGFATFLAMAYILTVNPDAILWAKKADIRWSSVFIATAFGSFVGTILMALLAKKPLALAPSMGLNNMIGGVIGGIYGFAFSFGNAMLIVLISGIVFFLISVIPGGKDQNGKLIALREKIFDSMPKSIRQAIPVGIGLFIAYIGLQKCGLIQSNEFTISSLVSFNEAKNWKLGGVACSAGVTLFGLFMIAILTHFKIKGSVFVGILSATLLAIPLKVANINILLGKEGFTWKFWENFSNFFSMDSSKGGVFLSAFTEGFNLPSGSFMTIVMLVITICMTDMFDTMGSVIGCARNAGFMDENGKPIDYKRIMITDSTATCVGSIFGTSPITTFVESGAGIAAGGRTGLSALVCAVLFLVSICLLPLFAFIPMAATASALIYVGVLMMSNVKDIDFSSVKNSVPVFLTIIIMLLSYSITSGIGIGVASYVIISLICYPFELIKYKKGNLEEKPKCDISLVCFVVFILFMIYFLVPTNI